MATTSTDRFGGTVTETTGQRFTGTAVSTEGQRFTGTVAEVGTQRFTKGIIGVLNGYFRPAFFAGTYFAADLLRGDTPGIASTSSTDLYSGTVAENTTQRYTGTLS